MKKPITFLGNYEFSHSTSADLMYRQMRDLDFPHLVNPAKKYGPMHEYAYWETFAQRPEFYSLVNAHKLKEYTGELYYPFQTLDQICAPHIENLEAELGRTFNLKLPMMIEIMHPPAANHIDTPVRDYTMNWYPFETFGHEVYFGEETITPKRGDLFLFDVDLWHGTRHPNPGLVAFMSMSLRFR